MFRNALLLPLLLVALCTTPVSAARAARSSAIGGQPVAAHEAPWSVRISAFLDDSLIGGDCSGSIVDATHVLTAGHCTYQRYTPWSGYRVRAGITSSRSAAQPEEQLREAFVVRRHPYYAANTFLQDVALLELGSPFDFSTPAVQPIPIARSVSSAPPGSDLWLFGWVRSAPKSTIPRSTRSSRQSFVSGNAREPGRGCRLSLASAPRRGPPVVAIAAVGSSPGRPGFWWQL